MTKTMLGLEKPILDRIEMYAEALEIPVNLIIQNLLINSWAQQAAEHELGIPSRYMQLMKTSNGEIITGETLFYALKGIYKHKLQKEMGVDGQDN